MNLTLETTLREAIASYPSTGEIFIQHGRMFRVRPGHLYASYDPSLTVAEYATLNALDPESLLATLRAAAEGGEARGPALTPDPGPTAAALVEPIGYTGAYRERAPVATVPITRVLRERGPD